MTRQNVIHALNLAKILQIDEKLRCEYRNPGGIRFA